MAVRRRLALSVSPGRGVDFNNSRLSILDDLYDKEIKKWKLSGSTMEYCLGLSWHGLYLCLRVVENVDYWWQPQE
jgi:hypothetical protein